MIFLLKHSTALLHSEELQLICLNPQDFSSETCGLRKYLGTEAQKMAFLSKHIKVNSLCTSRRFSFHQRKNMQKEKYVLMVHQNRCIIQIFDKNWPIKSFRFNCNEILMKK